MRLFIAEKVKALFYIIFALFSFASFLSYNSSDPGINFVGNNSETTNMMGLFGAYFSSIMYTFLGYSCYLLPIFFMTHGSAALLSNKRGSVFIKLISLLFAIIYCWKNKGSSFYYFCHIFLYFSHIF